MKLAILDTKNPAYNSQRWSQLEALAKGGEDFKKHITCFLPQNPVEPENIYQQRKQQAHYRSYMGSIINLYTAWLFAAAFSIKASKRGTKDPVENLAPFYGEFQEDVGGETQLSAFVQERVRSALTMQAAHWLVELPSNNGEEPANAKEFETRKLGNATLKAIERSELWDYQEDDKHQLVYAILHTEYKDRADWTKPRDITVETWRVYDRDNVHTFELRYSASEGRPRDPEFEVHQIGSAPHGFKRVPLVRLTLPKELCIGEQTADTQLAHFREDNALSWLIKRTCYCQPVFNLESEDSLPTLGAGYAIVLGKDDKFGWTAPPVAPFDILQKTVDAKRDEIYRIVHQMAQGVDNNAETVGRSADSKEIDAAATRIMLNTYGAMVSKPIEETYELISEARGESEYEWSVEGFAGYDTATVASLIGNATNARALGIPSQTFHKELCTKVALALHPEADQRVKDTIRTEIHSATFKVDSIPLDEKALQGPDARAELDRAKAEAEPIKAKASMKSASQPKAAAPRPPG